MAGRWDVQRASSLAAGWEHSRALTTAAMTAASTDWIRAARLVACLVGLKALKKGDRKDDHWGFHLACWMDESLAGGTEGSTDDAMAARWVSQTAGRKAASSGRQLDVTTVD